jgi:NAD(P)-dependent dehydrogenase (short-subunit alcohol dehydrogenase family)
MAPYNVGKAGVIALSETLYAELAAFNIQVTVLCPTYFQTNLMRSFRSSSPRQRHISKAFFNRASAQAVDVAGAGLTAVQNRELMVIPQTDGQQVFAAKSKNYAGYFARLRAQVVDGVFDKLAQEGAGKPASRKNK